MITAAQVKSLREKTGAGMMDCKKALQDSDGDVDVAVKVLREKGIAQAAKRADRVAVEGRVAARIVEDGTVGALVELNCETDFVAKNEDFGAFVDTLIDHVLSENPGSAFGDSVMAPAGKTVGENVTELMVVMGEKIQARRFARLEAAPGAALGSYVHPGDRIAVAVELQGVDGADPAALHTLLRDVAMQIASMQPLFATRDEVDPAWLQQEREIAVTQAKETGKPEKVQERIAEGKLASRLKDVCLADQIFVKSSGKQTVAQYLSEAGKAAGAPALGIAGFVRFQLGESLDAAGESEG